MAEKWQGCEELRACESGAQRTLVLVICPVQIMIQSRAMLTAVPEALTISMLLMTS